MLDKYNDPNVKFGLGTPCDYCDGLGPKIWIWDFGLIFGTQTWDSGLQASDLGLRLVTVHGVMII